MEKIAVCAIAHPTPYNHRSQATVMVAYAGDDEVVDLFDYYDDELTFWAEEFIGLTRDEAIALFHCKDVAYLQS